MKIQLLSDLHNEFEPYELEIDKVDVLVLAGDIDIGVKGIRWLNSLSIDIPVIYVPGNHEYYKNTYPKLIGEAKAEIARSNIHFMENESITIDGVTFHACTLWTDFELFGDPRLTGYECQRVMTDFKKIRRLPNYSKLRAIDVSLIHLRSLKWLGGSLKSSKGPNVVVTHHAPSIRSAADMYRDDIITAAYASNLESFINEHRPDAWIHGHMHNSSDYTINGCRVVCNPRGYKGQFNPDFEDYKVIEVSLD